MKNPCFAEIGDLGFCTPISGSQTTVQWRNNQHFDEPDNAFWHGAAIEKSSFPSEVRGKEVAFPLSSPPLSMDPFSSLLSFSVPHADHDSRSNSSFFSRGRRLPGSEQETADHLSQERQGLSLPSTRTPNWTRVTAAGDILDGVIQPIDLSSEKSFLRGYNYKTIIV